MRKILIVAIREFLETTKTKAFLIGLLMAPLLWVVMINYVGKIEKATKSAAQPTRQVSVADQTRELFAPLKAAVEARNREMPQQKVMLAELRQDENVTSPSAAELSRMNAFAVLVLPDGLIDGKSPAELHMNSKNVSDMMFADQVENLLNRVVAVRRGARYNLSPEITTAITRRVSLVHKSVEGKASKGSDMMARTMVPFVFMLFLFMGIMASSGQLLTSVIEEKSSRVVEVLLSAVTPLQFMVGKILGLSLVGLLTVAIWGGFAYAGAAQKGITGVLTPTTVGFFLIYYVLGFLFFSALFASVGAACNTIKEAQSVMMPINFLFVVPMVGWFYFAANPQAFWTRALSFVPPMTPMLMVLRISAYPGLSRWEIAATLVVLVIAVVVVLWAAAKIFRTGILMYGKPPRLREMARWIRYR